MENYFGGLGGLGGFLNSASTNPFLLAGLQMLGNSTPQIGRIPNVMQGVPQTLFQAGQAQRKQLDKLQAEKDLASLYDTSNNGDVTQPATPQAPAAPAQQYSSNTSSTDKNQFDPTAVASQFKDLGATYGGMTVNDAATELAKTNKTAAAQLVNRAQQAGLSPDTVLNDQSLSDPKVGPEIMKSFMGQQYKLSDDQWQQVHQAWNGARTTPEQQNQQQPGPFDNAPTGTDQQALGTMVTGQRAGEPTIGSGMKDSLNFLPQDGQPPQGANYGGQPAAQNLPSYGTPPAQVQNLPQVGTPPAAVRPLGGPQQVAQAQPQAPVQPAPQQPIASGPRFNPKALSHVLANPDVPAGVKAALLEQANPKLQFVPQQDGTIVAINPRDGSARVVYQSPQGKMQFGVIGENLGNKIYGYTDAANRKTYDVNGNPLSAQQLNQMNQGGPPVYEGDTVQERLQKVDPQIRETVRKIATYNQQPPSNLAMKSGYWQKVMEEVNKVEPDWNQNIWTERNTFARNMSSTAPNSWGTQVRSAGTIVEHMGSGLKNLDVIAAGPKGSTSGQYGESETLNKFKDFANREYSGDKNFNNAMGGYDTDRKAVAGEVVRLLTNGVGSEKDRHEWEDKFDLGKHSLSYVRGAWNEAYNIMYGRLVPIAEQKSRAYRVDTDPMSLLPDKDAVKTLQKVREQGAPTPVQWGLDANGNYRPIKQ